MTNICTIVVYRMNLTYYKTSANFFKQCIINNNILLEYTYKLASKYLQPNGAFIEAIG